MTAPLGGGGFVLSIDTDTSSPITVGRIRRIGSRSTPANKIDVSSADTEQFREFVYGLGDRGDLNCEGVYEATAQGQESLRGLVGDGLAHAWSITLKDGTAMTGEANVLQFDFELQYDGAYTFTASLGVTGDIDVSPAS